MLLVNTSYRPNSTNRMVQNATVLPRLTYGLAYKYKYKYDEKFYTIEHQLEKGGQIDVMYCLH